MDMWLLEAGGGGGVLHSLGTQRVAAALGGTSPTLGLGGLTQPVPSTLTWNRVSPSSGAKRVPGTAPQCCPTSSSRQKQAEAQQVEQPRGLSVTWQQEAQYNYL